MSDRFPTAEERWQRQGVVADMNKRVKPSEGNKTFCMAPWTHTYLSPQMERRLCCSSREDSKTFTQYIDTKSKTQPFKPDTLEEHWNSDYMKKIRVDLMAGKEIPQCQVCNHKLLSVATYRTHFNTLFEKNIDEAFAKTKDDGHTDMKVTSWDYRFNNLCNFKCRMCGDMLSSSWEAETRKHNNWNKESQPWMASPLREQIKKFQDQQVVQEFIDSIETKQVREIYWCGGEPLMWDMHWKAMERIIELGFADEVYVRYNTNLSRTSFRKSNLFDLLKYFNDWQVCASMDGTGEVAEYIRDGLDYPQWLRNFKEGLSISTNARQMRLDFTITMPGLLELKNMFDLSVELNTEVLTKVMFTFSNDEILSPLSLPKDLLHTIIDEALQYMEPRATNKQRALISVLKNLKTRDTFTPTKQGKLRQLWIDKIRKQDITTILAKDKRILEWWASI